MIPFIIRHNLSGEELKELGIEVLGYPGGWATNRNEIIDMEAKLEWLKSM